MIRTISVCERSIFVAPPDVKTLAAGVATEIFGDDTYTTNGEIVSRYVQNVTGADLYLAFGTNVCDANNQFHAVITDKQLFDCFPHRKLVTAYSAAGGKVSTTKLIRVDLGH